MNWPHRLLLTLVCGALLTACGENPPTAAPSSSAPAATTTTSQGRVPPTTDQLAADEQTAYRAAVAAHPGADLDKCDRDTKLTDKACGSALTAAGKIAAETARRLRAKSPEYAELLHGAVLFTAGEFQASFQQLRDPIPCYGLSDAPKPPAQLRAEAEGICAEAAAIAITKYRLFLNQVE
jgi:hypothetical protein